MCPISKKYDPVSKNNGPVSKKDGPVSKKNGPVSKKNGPFSIKNGPVSKKNGLVSKKNKPRQFLYQNTYDEDIKPPTKKKEKIMLKSGISNMISGKINLVIDLLRNYNVALFKTVYMRERVQFVQCDLPCQ